MRSEATNANRDENVIANACCLFEMVILSYIGQFTESVLAECELRAASRALTRALVFSSSGFT